MTRGPTTHILEVRGDFACWSRPELKVERWSYPCPTPSAARGIFDAIYWKPRFYWQIDRIELLATPTYIALRRNEVSATVPSDRTIKSWIKGTAEPRPIVADSPSTRQQRQTMAIRRPAVRISAHIVPRPGAEREIKALDQQFLRRARAGKCAWQPYLGCREFVAFFRLIEDLACEPDPVDHDQDIGWMLYDVFDLSRSNKPGVGKPQISVFQARIARGVLEVPPYQDDRVRKPEDRRAG
jgi:CRISPR-associated protein Cas5d